MATLVEVPHIGMDMQEVTLVEWLVADGDAIAKGDPIVTIETDKTNHDLEAETSGVIRALRGEQGDVLAVGAPLAWIVADGEEPPALSADNGGGDSETTADSAVEPAPEAEPSPSQANETGAQPTAVDAESSRVSAIRGLASPAARREAAARDLDIQQLPGSGPDGTVYRADVVASAPAEAVQTRSAETPEDADIVALNKIQRLTGERTQASFRDIPHFYLERDLDADALLKLQADVTPALDSKPSLGALLCFAIARTLAEHPRLNSRLAGGDAIELRRCVHLGVAVAGDDGLVVPVIRDAARLRLREFQARYQYLTTRARQGRLQSDELTGGTFTVSNLGMFGVDRFSAIINPPQAAILALGRLRTVPVWTDEQWQPTAVISATLSADHRVCDGADGGRFLADLAQRLSHWVLLL